MTYSTIENKNDFFQIANKVLFYLLITSIFLFPPISVVGNFPSIRLDDVLLIVIALVLLKDYKKVFEFITSSIFIKILIVFSIYIFLTILINNRIKILQDYFEIFKVFKFLLFFIYFYFYALKYNIYNFLKIVFCLVLVFNFLHYYNIFDFNNIIEPYYSDPKILDFFGLNSLGQPDTIRMMGSAGNPNINSILFLFFIAIFTPTLNKKGYEKIWYFIAFFGIILCQSRTGLISFLFVFAYTMIFYKLNYKSIILYSLIIITLFFSFSIISINKTYYSNTIDKKISKSQSVKGRIETWKHLYSMVKTKPVFGHAPYKEYFYNNEIYSEDEYILFLWRYGIIGLLFYIFMISYPIYYFYRSHTSKPKTFPLLLFSIIIVISAITNNPINNPQILLMYSLMLAIYYISNKSIENEKTVIVGS